jgi:regulator of sigma E protease
VSYVYAVLGFAALIVLHEAGHFVAAKAVGMRVERFSLFFGPMWIKRTIGETEYGIATIPLGGYVKITGMTPNEVYESPEIEARGYYNQPVWKRIVVIAAGPAVNLLVALVLISGFYLANSHYDLTSNGQNYVSTTAIGGIVQHSPAARALKLGDVVVSVDGVHGGTAALENQIRTHECAGGLRKNGCEAATPATLVIRRDGVTRTIKIRPRYSTSARKPLIGFEFEPKPFADGLGFSIRYGSSDLWDETKATVSTLAQVFRSKDRKKLSGIVGAYEVTQQSFNEGTSMAVRVLALISLSLGLVNLFPFLPLDGGHIFWAIVEKLRGRRVSWATMEKASIVGFVLVAALVIIGLSNNLTHPPHLQ